MCHQYLRTRYVAACIKAVVMFCFLFSQIEVAYIALVVDGFFLAITFASRITVAKN